ncbi:MAG: TPR end-of-group domain-containing protein [Chthoniobacterales bacterium]
MDRRLTAILAADAVGYSRLMGADEAGTLATLKSIRADIIDPAVSQHRGRVFKLTGDGILAEFPSVVSGLACAVKIQTGMEERNNNSPPDRSMEFRIGLHLGDVIVDGDDIYGDGVNIATRIESVAQPNGIAVSSTVRDHIGNRLDLQFDDLGEQQLKNIEKPIRLYSVVMQVKSLETTAGSEGQRPSIAVLPFTNMSGDPEQEYFSDGITEDIITDLSKISGLSVTARHSAFSYKGKAVKIQQVARELGVAFVVEGSVRKAGSRVRVTGQLVSSADGSHLWADRFDRDLTDIFAIQDEITQAIVEELKVKLLPQEKKLITQQPTDSVEAYTYYLRGRDFSFRYSKRYHELAHRMYSKAVELDPNYARAYAGIAICDASLYMVYQSDIPIEQILNTSAKALALDKDLAEAHTARGVALWAADKVEEANAEFELGVSLDPNSFEAHFVYARPAFQQGNIARAVELLERAAEINAADYKPPALAIHMLRSLGRTSDVKSAAERTIKLAERELAANPEDPRPAIAGALALLELGETDRAKDWAKRAEAIEAEDAVALYNLACVASHLKDADRALKLLDRVIQNRRPLWRAWIENDSDLDGIRSDPRFPKFIDRLHEMYPDK